MIFMNVTIQYYDPRLLRLLGDPNPKVTNTVAQLIMKFFSFMELKVHCCVYRCPPLAKSYFCKSLFHFNTLDSAYCNRGCYRSCNAIALWSLHIENAVHRNRYLGFYYRFYVALPRPLRKHNNSDYVILRLVLQLRCEHECFINDLRKDNSQSTLKEFD